MCADSLARMSFTLGSDFSSFHNPLVNLIDAFEDDLNRMYVTRMCPELDFLL